jgi:GH43 family beta-xylosidase
MPRPCLAVVLGTLLLVCPAPSRAADVMAWWRFEDVRPGRWLEAQMGNRFRPYTTTADTSGHDHDLRTYNTRPTLYPPDTSPGFTADVPTGTVNGGAANHGSVRFSGKQYLYTSDADVDAPLYVHRGMPFTVEGMFKLSATPYDFDGRPQVILAKSAMPVVDPVQLAIESAPPLTTRPSHPTPPPTTSRSTSEPSTRPVTRPTTTTTSSRPSFDGPTERVNDHPVQPIECYVAGTNSWPEPFAGVPADRLAVRLVDTAGRSHLLLSDQSVRANRWYAFAVVYDGRRATLLLNDLTASTGYQRQQSVTRLEGGLFPCRGTWMVGCGLIDDVRENWWQGWIDEVRLSADAVPTDHLLASGARPAPVLPSAGEHGTGPTPASVVHGLADPDVLVDQGTYYLYGTRDQLGFPVYTSTDLLHWTQGPDVFHRRRGMWAVNRYWAPAVIHYRGRYYLFYSALGHLPESGDRLSHRVCVAVSDDPQGPFEPHVAPLPLIGKAVIDPAAFVDPTDGHVYLYFVADMSENEVSQIFVARLNDDLTGVVGEPVLCIQPSQAWEGKFWNEGPHVFRASGAGGEAIYVMTYSAQFWHSPEYGVGFATSRTPTGPWTKNPANPILQRWRGLFGSGGDCVVPMPAPSKDYAILFHADGPPDSHRRDTYVDRLVVTPDARLGVMLTPKAWSPGPGGGRP